MKVSIHLGAGDAIICAPIIAKLAAENDEVIIPSWAHNVESVQSFFVNYPNVKIQVVTDGHLHGFEDAEIELGHYSAIRKLPDESFVQWFFRQAGMTEEERWKWCPINDMPWIEAFEDEKMEPFIFIHDDPERGFIIKHKEGKNILFPRKEGDILKWVKYLMHADEIHCIDSSFLHLAEAVPTKGKLFYHQYARPNSTDNYKFRKKWTILN